MNKQVKMTKGNLTVLLALTKLEGNKRPYFSATAEQRNPRTGRVESCGAMHDAILAEFPEVADFVALHLSDDDGVPLYAQENGYYWLAGALGGLGEKFHGSNDKAHSVQDCLKIFAQYVRITPEQADALIDSFRGGQSAVRGRYAEWVINQHPRWKAEADAVIAKYLTTVAA